MKIKKTIITTLLLTLSSISFYACSETPNSDTITSTSISSSEEIENYYTVKVDGYSQKVKEGERAIEPDIPYKEGYLFVGWYEGDIKFSFDTQIYRDYVINSKFELDLQPSSDVSNVNGETLKNNLGNYVTNENNTISYLSDVSFMTGKINFKMRGEGKHGIFFRTNSETYNRGRLTGDYYQLEIDNFGNISLYRSINNDIQLVAFSLDIREDYNPSNFYSFSIEVNNTGTTLYRGFDAIITYADGSMPAGDGFAIYSAIKGAEFDIVDQESGGFSALIKNKTLVWFDPEDAEGYIIKVNEEEISVGADVREYDLKSYLVEVGEYTINLYRVYSGISALAFSQIFYVEGIPEDIDIFSGNFVMHGDDYYSKESKSLALLKDTEIYNGTISGNITPGSANDCGIIFRVDDGGSTSFWEQQPCSYYTALINFNGEIILGKVNGPKGTWEALAIVPLSSFNVANSYKMKVVFNNDIIDVYIDGALYITYTDSSPLLGRRLGFRSFASGVTFSKLEVEGSDGYEFVASVEKYIEKGEDLVLNAYIKNGSEIISINKDNCTIKGFDKNTIGKQELTIEYTYLGILRSVTTYVYVVNEIYYHLDLSSVDEANNSLTGWTAIKESGSKSVVSFKKDGIYLTNTGNYGVSNIYYEGKTSLSNYCVDIDYDLPDYQNVSRWGGCLVGVSKSYGYIRTYSVANGKTGGGYQTVYDLSSSNVNNVDAFADCQTFNTINKGSHVSTRTVLSGSKLVYEVNGEVGFKVNNISTNYQSGSFGFTHGGGSYVIRDLWVTDAGSSLLLD